MLLAAAGVWAVLLVAKGVDGAQARFWPGARGDGGKGGAAKLRNLVLHPGLALLDLRGLARAANEWSPSAATRRAARLAYGLGAVAAVALHFLVPMLLALNIICFLVLRAGVAPPGLELLTSATVSGSGGGGAPLKLLPNLPGSERNAEAALAGLVAFLIALAVHEAGHGLAAIFEGLKLRRVGVFMAGPAIPGAFVAVEEVVHVLPCESQLRVYGAGAFHNLVFAAFAAAVLALTGAAARPFYGPEPGAVMSYVDPMSPVAELFQPGEIVVAINEAPIADAEDFYRVLADAHDGRREWPQLFPTAIAGDRPGAWLSSVGVCLPEADVAGMPRDCCGAENPLDQRALLLMAWHGRTQQNVLDLAGSCTCVDEDALFHRLEQDKQSTCSRRRACADGSACGVPLVAAREHIFQFRLASGERVTYEGKADHLLDGVTATNSKPRYLPEWLQAMEDEWPSLEGLLKGAARMFVFRLPDLFSGFLQKSLQYNLSLALLNAAPIRLFDGDAISRALWRYWLPLKHMRIYKACVFWSTALFVVNVGISFFCGS
uniref:Endopeptidase S2P n=1 Tax=Phaeomonas parva TaxID=124430 RepID=A0A7S1XR35_9STRA|mmetsp:Transcript_26790/g.83917  ORF Transcript_26790/g.83917 Transcript_26790/m.83917 type:complete len:547 (+) Transcript_26790:322-1962(+)